jgi:hypothetical protein
MIFVLAAADLLRPVVRVRLHALRNHPGAAQRDPFDRDDGQVSIRVDPMLPTMRLRIESCDVSNASISCRQIVAVHNKSQRRCFKQYIDNPRSVRIVTDWSPGRILIIKSRSIFLLCGTSGEWLLPPDVNRLAKTHEIVVPMTLLYITQNSSCFSCVDLCHALT